MQLAQLQLRFLDWSTCFVPQVNPYGIPDRQRDTFSWNDEVDEVPVCFGWRQSLEV